MVLSYTYTKREIDYKLQKLQKSISYLDIVTGKQIGRAHV